MTPFLPYVTILSKEGRARYTHFLTRTKVSICWRLVPPHVAQKMLLFFCQPPMCSRPCDICSTSIYIYIYIYICVFPPILIPPICSRPFELFPPICSRPFVSRTHPVCAFFPSRRCGSSKTGCASHSIRMMSCRCPRCRITSKMTLSLGAPCQRLEQRRRPKPDQSLSTRSGRAARRKKGIFACSLHSRGFF